MYIKTVSGNSQKLHIVDISENSMVKSVREIRSPVCHIDGELKTFALEAGKYLDSKM